MRSRVVIAVLALVAALVVPLTPAAQAAGIAATTSISVSPGGAVPAGTELTVTVTVVGANPYYVAGGEVVLAVKGVDSPATDLTDGTATFTIPGNEVLPGTLALSASYGGDDDHDPSSAETGVLVSFIDYPPLIGDQIAPFYADIRWMTGQGVTAGYSDNGYHPTAAVSRQAMAAFLYRAAHPGQTAPTCSTAPFPDVPTTNQFCGEITWLAQQGISTGYSDGTFRPIAAVSRGAMAQFLYRFKVGPTAPACTTAPFADVPVGDAACGAITWLVSKSVTNGYSDGTYRPTAPVSRQAMAAFLHRLFGDAIRILKTGSIELDPSDVISVDYNRITVKSTATLPPVGGILIISTAVNGGAGVFGRVESTQPGESDELVDVFLDLSIALDDAYTELHIVATNLSIPAVVPTGGGMSRTGAGARSAEFECDGPGTDITFDLTNLKISAFDLDIGLHEPRMSLAISYDPSVTISVPGGVAITCQMSADILPPIIIPSPPIVISTSLYGYLSFSAGVAMTATAGIHLGANVRAHGTHSDTNLTHAPFAEVSLDAPQLQVVAQVGLTVSAKLADVVGLSGTLGVTANLAWGNDELGRDCLKATVGPNASLDAVLNVFVHEFSATLLSSDFPQKEVWKHCFGGGTWNGTGSEHLVGSGTWDEGVWISTDQSDLTRSYVIDDNVSTATASGYEQSTFHWADPNQICQDATNIITFGPVTENLSNDFYVYGGPDSTFWPSLGTFLVAAHTHDTSGQTCNQEFFDTFFRSSLTPEPAMNGPLWTGRSHILTCDPVDWFPSDVQAIVVSMTLNCSDTDAAHPATATLTFNYDLVQDPCDTRVDSDGDGVGDCAEYYGGGDPNHAG